MTAPQIPPERAAAHWQKTRSLMWLCLAIWLVFGFVIHLFARDLNTIHVIGFPIGFYFAAQGSLIAFVVLIFWYAHRQNKIDEEFGVDEEQ